MKTIFRNLIMACFIAIVSISFFSCAADDEFAPVSVNTRSVQSITVSGVISTNTTWYRTNTYQLSGKVYVANGATLTIEDGTLIEGLPSTKPENASALIITRGSQINAVGTSNNPIVFTASNGTKGGWGGLVLLGNARINQSANQYIEGIDPDSVPAGVNVTYGRADDTYNTESSGTLSYVRVEYAGAKIIEGNELNSFTFGGVGSGTTLDHLQAYYGADDAFEFFGGKVNAKYLLAVAPDDDAFDFDFGYTGKLQFLVSVLDPAAPYSGNANGIESDNNGSGADVTPYTRPVISNLTIVGTSDGDNGSASGTIKFGTHFRRATRFVLRNSVVYGFNYSPSVIYLDDTEGPLGVTSGVSKLNDLTNTLANDSSYFANNVVGKIVGSSYAWYNTGWTPASTNDFVNATASGLGIPYPFETDYYFDSTQKGLKSDSIPASTGVDFTGLDTGLGGFFTTTSYKGALSSSNYWITASWVNKDFPVY